MGDMKLKKRVLDIAYKNKLSHLGSYFSSLDIVPIISLSYFFHGLYHLQLPGLYNNNQTKWVMYIRGLGALINIVGNIILIPL